MLTANRPAPPIGWLVFFITFVACLPFYSATIHALDQEEGMLLVTDSLVRKGWFDANAHLNIADPTITLIPEQIGPDGNNYLKFGLPTSLLAAPLYALAWVLPVGAVQAAFLLNPLLTAATAASLAHIVLTLGFSPTTATLTALAYGLTSMALVYSRFFGSEPLVAFSFALLVLALTRLHTAPPTTSVVTPAALAGFAIGLSIATRPATAIVLPIVGLWLLWALPQRGPLRTWLTPLLAFGIAGFLWLLFVLAYNYLRFGDPLSTGYGTNETFDTPVWVGLYGQLFSSGKSLFLYSPPLVLAVGGLLRFWRQQRALLTLLLATAAAYLTLYSVWFGWWGGVYWGPRHAMPILILLFPLTAPLFDAARTHRPTRIVVTMLVMLGLGVQLLGGLMDFEPYEVMLNQLAPGATQALIWLPRFSPIVYHLTHFRLDDVIWVTAGFAPWLPVLALGALGWLGWWLWRALHHHPAVRSTLPQFALVASAIAFVTLIYANQSPPYGPLAGPRTALAVINQHARPGDVLLSRTGERTTLIMNDLRARIPWATFDARPELPTAEVDFHLERLTANAERLWLLTPEPRETSNPTARHLESWLSARAFPLTDTVYGPSARLLTFRFFDDHHWTPTTAQFADWLTLTDLWYGLEDDALLVALRWQASAPPPANVSVSMQLLAPDNTLAVQLDRWPVNATRPTLTWQPGETLTDRYALPLTDLPAGDYTLWLVVYDSTTLARLPVATAPNTPPTDIFFAGPVNLP